MTASQLSVTFLAQMALILLVCRVVGVLARRIGQPQVVGEMIAGVAIGPSLLGQLAPNLEKLLFPPDSTKVLYVLAQLGVGLYMFLVGVEFRADAFRRQVRAAVSISLAGVVVPFLLAAVLTPWLLAQPGLFGDRTGQMEASLFLGGAIAITAFPMLARILYEADLTGTSLGSLALAAGAVDDAVAWCFLAIVLATFSGTPSTAFRAIFGGLAYAIFSLTLAPRLLAPLGRRVERLGHLDSPHLAVLLALLMLCTCLTDAIGIHAVFGGFLLGTAVPRGLVADQLKKQVEPFTVTFLLPIFFTFSGLNTRLDLLTDPSLAVAGLTIFAASILGKGVACWGAARLTGQDNRTALAIGTLMNARGLMELIIINIGLQRHVIETPLFSILALMAVLTTLMATPLFEFVYGRHARDGAGRIVELGQTEGA